MFFLPPSYAAKNLVARPYWSGVTLRPAAIRAGILIEKPAQLFSKEGDRLSRFGFHNLGRHSLASFLMDEEANPAVVQAIMGPSQMDMALYYAHWSTKQKRAALDHHAEQIVSPPKHCAAIAGPGISLGDRGQGSELWCYHVFTAD